jgi:hypothetical protein
LGSILWEFWIDFGADLVIDFGWIFFEGDGEFGGRIWAHFGIIWCKFCDDLGPTLGSIWGQFQAYVGAHLGSDLASFFSPVMRPILQGATGAVGSHGGL